MSEPLELRLSGPSGEPDDFARTIVSHGVAELPPNRVDLAARVLETTRSQFPRRTHGASHRTR